MNASTLYPPNCGSLSDQVIGHVVQRVEFSGHERFISPRNVPAKTGMHSPTGPDNGPALPARLPPNLPQRAAPNKLDKDASAPLSHAEHVLIRRRLQSRQNMARYRTKLLGRVTGLEDSIHELREETYRLELQRQLLDFGISTARTSWNVVSEYFRLFRHALKEPLALHDSRSGMEELRPQHFQVHRAFLTATMAPDLISTSGLGVEALLQDYRRISRYFPDLDVQLVSMENAFGDTIIATTNVTATITEDTLGMAFPRLVNDPKLWSTLGKKLLGNRIDTRGAARIIWDDETRRVVGLHCNTDLLTPVLKLVGNMDGIARVFDRSLVRPDGSLAPEGDF